MHQSDEISVVVSSSPSQSIISDITVCTYHIVLELEPIKV